jgi:REP element-mobilizing transposase RayT
VPLLPRGQRSLFSSHPAGRRRRRRPAGVTSRIPHRPRPPLDGHFPVHVTLRLRDGLPNLRRRDLYTILRRAFRLGRDRFHFRLAHFSVQHHHLHLICEAPTALALGRGMQGLGIRIAKGVNRTRGKKGTVFRERYHAHELRTLTETRRALRYVAHNDHHHGNVDLGSARRADPCSSFYFWVPNRALFVDEEAPVMAPLTDHLKAGLRLELHLKGPPPAPVSAAAT